MTNDSKVQDQSLPLAVLEWMDRVCLEFEAAWTAGQSPRIESVLGDAREPGRSALLRELLLLELDYQSHSGQTLSLEDYQTRFPDHSPLVFEVFRQYQTADTYAEPSHKEKAARKKITLDEFIQSLGNCGLMSAEEVHAFLDDLPQEGKPNQAWDLAKEMVRQKKLTKFQAQAVYQHKTRGLVLGNYVLLDRIGRGGMGQVYKARHRRLDRIVALKILPSAIKKSEGALKRFEREARAIARLAHPNIVTVYDADEAEGIHFFVMEYVSGSDLFAVIKKHGPLPIAQAVDYTLQAAEALEYAHSQGIIHRDVKPANLLLDPQGTIKVLDMGLARIDESLGEGDAAQDAVRQGSQAKAGNEGLTRSGAILGTADYMAPEQAADSRQVDHRADIYSLGCTLYFLLTGRTVYPGKTLLQKMIAHCEQPIPSLCDDRPDVSETLDGVFRRMIAKSPEERYRSMSDVLAALRACIPSEDDRTGVPQPPPLTMEHLRTLGGQDSDFIPAGPDSSEPPTFQESDLDQSIRFPFVAPPPVFQAPRAHVDKTPNRWGLVAGGMACVPILAMLLLGSVAISGLWPASERTVVSDRTVPAVPSPSNPETPTVQDPSNVGTVVEESPVVQNGVRGEENGVQRANEESIIVTGPVEPAAPTPTKVTTEPANVDPEPPPPEPMQTPERDIYRLQGLWRNKAAWENPTAVVSDFANSSLISALSMLYIAGEELQAGGEKLRVPFTNDDSLRAPFRLFPAADPKQFAVLVPWPGADGRISVAPYGGIYEIAGDTLRICFSTEEETLPAEFKTDLDAGIMLVEYERLAAGYAELLAGLQGEWRLVPQGFKVFVGGESMHLELGRAEMAFRLNPDTQPPEVKLRSIFSSEPPIQGTYSLLNGTTEMRFPMKTGDTNPLVVDNTGKTNRYLLDALRIGNELIVRRDAPDATRLSKLLAERIYPLAERKKYLQQVTPDTPFANQAAEELARMPTDGEIREIDAEFALMIVERDPPGQRKRALQDIIDKHDETKAAKEASQLIARLPADEEIREIEAVFALWTAKRDPPGRKKRTLQAIIDRYGETKAADEARELFDRLPSDKELQERQAEIAREIDAEIAEEIAAEIARRREMEAEDALKAAKQAPLWQREQAFQAIIARYGDTKVAEEAGQLLVELPSDAVMHEMEAQSLVDTAKEQMKDNKLKSARENLYAATELSPKGPAAAEAESLIEELNEREAAEELRLGKLLLESNPAAARSRLRVIVRKYPDTEAAVEAQRLLK
jgi:uncharacterized protein (TIGR03067 family)